MQKRVGILYIICQTFNGGAHDHARGKKKKRKGKRKVVHGDAPLVPDAETAAGASTLHPQMRWDRPRKDGGRAKVSVLIHATIPTHARQHVKRSPAQAAQLHRRVTINSLSPLPRAAVARSLVVYRARSCVALPARTVTFSRGRQRSRLRKHAPFNLAFAQTHRRCRADIYVGARVTAAASDTRHVPTVG